MDLSTAIYTFITLFSLFIWEHIANVNKFKIRPTWPLLKLIILSRIFFYHVGVIIGRIASIVTHLHLDELMDTVFYILTLFWDLIMSIYYIKNGIMYISNMLKNVKQIYSTSIVLIFASVTILCILVFWYFDIYSLVNYDEFTKNFAYYVNRQQFNNIFFK